MEYQSKLKDENITLIRNGKEYGDIVKVANKLGFTKQYVSQVCSIHSDQYDEGVVLAMLEIIKKRRAKQDALRKKISKTAKSLKAA